MSKKWVTFDFQGNQAWGRIESHAQWQRKIIKPYTKYSGTDMLLRARRGPDLSDGTPLFGFLIYCDGEELGEWARKQGIDLPLK